MLIVEQNPDDNPVKRVFENRDEKDVKAAIDLAKDAKIVEECYRVASEYCARACADLNALPDNTVRQSLIELANYVISRDI